MRSNVIAFVMAGGKGTRLEPLTEARSKPAVPSLVSPPGPGRGRARWLIYRSNCESTLKARTGMA